MGIYMYIYNVCTHIYINIIYPHNCHHHQVVLMDWSSQNPIALSRSFRLHAVSTQS